MTRRQIRKLRGKRWHVVGFEIHRHPDRFGSAYHLLLVAETVRGKWAYLNYKKHMYVDAARFPRIERGNFEYLFADFMRDEGVVPCGPIVWDIPEPTYPLRLEDNL
jgi:hypothetical protein